MKKMYRDQSGIAHLGLLIVVGFVVTAVGFAGFRVYSNSQQSTEVLGASTTKNQPKVKAKVSKATASSGGVQYVVREQVKDGKKTKYIPRGNVPVELIASTDKQRCRDAGKVYERKGSIVFAGKTDAAKAHKDNLGKIKADACTVGNYKAAIKLSGSYEAVGASSKDVKVNKKKVKKVTFTIKKKGTPAPKSEASNQSNAPAPAPAPAPLAAAPITPVQEKAAIDTTNRFESDMFFKIFKYCETGNVDLGEKLELRKDFFRQNSSAYMTKSLIDKVNSQMSGDAFPLLGVQDLKCGQYELIERKESKPLLSSGNGSSAVVEHQFTAQARELPLTGFQKAPNVTKTWVYNLAREGDLWKIDSIQVK